MQTKHHNKQANSKSTVKKSAEISEEIRRNHAAYGLLAPFLVLFLLFFIIPILAAVPLAFTDFRLPGTPEFSGLANFRFLFGENDLFAAALKNSLLSLLITGLGGFVLAAVAAALVNQLKKPLKTLFAIAFSLPTFTYGAFAVFALFAGKDASSPLNSFLLSLGLTFNAVDVLNDPVFSLILTQLVKLWSSFGIAFLALLCGFEKKENPLYDAAKIEGVTNRIHEFFLITVPSAAANIAFAAAVQIAAALSPVGVYTTNSVNMTLTDYMLQLGTQDYRIGTACAVIVLLTAATLILYFIARRLVSLCRE